jgi:hypothetical protein
VDGFCIFVIAGSCLRWIAGSGCVSQRLAGSAPRVEGASRRLFLARLKPCPDEKCMRFHGFWCGFVLACCANEEERSRLRDNSASAWRSAPAFAIILLQLGEALYSGLETFAYCVEATERGFKQQSVTARPGASTKPPTLLRSEGWGTRSCFLLGRDCEFWS